MHHLFFPPEMVPYLQPQGETIFLNLKNTHLVVPPDSCQDDTEIFNSLSDTGVTKFFNLTYYRYSSRHICFFHRKGNRCVLVSLSHLCWLYRAIYCKCSSCSFSTLRREVSVCLSVLCRHHQSVLCVMVAPAAKQKVLYF